MKYGISEREIEVANLFTKLGYFSRFHIQIFPVDSKYQASDIDVFATRFNSHLASDLNLIEVKEGYGKVTDLFRLYGLKTYFQKCTAYLVADKIFDTTLEIAKRLGVRAITFNRLKDLTARDLKRVEEKKRFHVDLNINHLEKIIDSLSLVKNVNEELFWSYHYLWLETDPYKKFYHIQRLFSRVKEVEGEKKDVLPQEALDWYKRELFCLSLLSAILMASDVRDLDPRSLFQYVENKFYNVGTSKEGKMKVREGIQKLASQIEKLSKGVIEVPLIEVVPSYIGDLATLLRFLIGDAPFVQSYLLIDDNVFRANLKGIQKNIKEIAVAQIQYIKVKTLNDTLLKILYERKPIDMAFNDFV